MRALNRSFLTPFLAAATTRGVLLGGVACGLAWAVVTLPPPAAAALTLGGFGATLWILQPEIAVLALTGICPLLLAFDFGEMRELRVHDLLLGLLALSTITSLRSAQQRWQRFSGFPAGVLLGLWAFLLLWGTVTYLLGPANQWLLKDPLRNSWYLYRDVWRVLLPFPLLAFCLKSRLEARRVIDLLLAVSTLAAAYAVVQAMRTGEHASEPFLTKNSLADYVVLAIPFVLSRLLLGHGGTERILHAGALLILLRALWLSGSRGGLVAFVASLLPFALFVPRRRVMAAAAGVLIFLSIVAVWRVDLLDRPMVRRFATLASPTEEENLQWREEQWGIFLERVAKRPWLGTGSEMDVGLAEKGRAMTAHNVYLGLAVRSGLPNLAAWLALLGLIGLWAGREASREKAATDRTLWVGLGGCLVALVVSNLVETSLLMPQVQQFLWTVLAISLLERSVRGAEPHPREVVLA